MTNLILDVDTGYDDALAILMASRTPDVRLLGVSCVAGNHQLDQVVTNTLKILEVAGSPDTPVAAGCILPLIEDVRPPAALHGRDGMADLDLPPPTRAPVSQHAVEWLRATLTQANEPVTLIALAPLTNLALLMRMYPQVKNKIQRIVIMGGTHISYGNTSPTAEFNIRCDPEAAHIVFTSGVPMTLYPLDPFRQIAISRDEATAMQSSASLPTQIAGRICLSVMNALKREMTFIGDAGAVAVAIDPSHAQIERYPVSIELNGSATRGMTVVDRRTPFQRTLLTEWWHASRYECDIVASVNAEYYKQLWLSRL